MKFARACVVVFVTLNSLAGCIPSKQISTVKVGQLSQNQKQAHSPQGDNKYLWAVAQSDSRYCWYTDGRRPDGAVKAQVFTPHQIEVDWIQTVTTHPIDDGQGLASVQATYEAVLKTNPLAGEASLKEFIAQSMDRFAKMHTQHLLKHPVPVLAILTSLVFAPELVVLGELGVGAKAILDTQKALDREKRIDSLKGELTYEKMKEISSTTNVTLVDALEMKVWKLGLERAGATPPGHPNGASPVRCPDLNRGESTPAQPSSDLKPKDALEAPEEQPKK